MNGEPLRINGSLRRRQALMVMSPFLKLDLSQRSFQQLQGVDYDEILSVIAMLKTVRTMLALAAFHLRNQADGCQNKVSLPVSVRKGCMRYNQKVFVNPKDAKRYANSSDPSISEWEHYNISDKYI